MKKTKNMVYAPSVDARELAVFTENDSILYRYYIIPAIDNLKKKVARGVFDAEKAVLYFYRVATAASDKYYQDFGYRFSVTARYTAAADLLEFFADEING